MISPMRQIDVLGRREDLDRALRVLQGLRAAEVVAAVVQRSEADPVETDLRADLATVVALRQHLPVNYAALPAQPAATAGLATRIDELAAEVAAIEDSIGDRADEIDTLTRQVEVLDRLSRLLPELAVLSDAELEQMGLATAAVVLDDPDGRIVDLLRVQLADLLADRFLLVTTRDEVGPEHGPSVGCLLVLPRDQLGTVESLLGADRITHLEVADEFAGRSLASTLQRMRSRLAALPAAQEDLRTAVTDLLLPRAAGLAALHHALAAELERREAARAARLSERTFALRLWVPRRRVSEVADALAAEVPTLVVAETPRRGVVGDPPVLLRGRRAVQPYERLVGFLSWPSPSGVDPSGLMAVMLPFLFGVMVGDVVYGAVLAVIGGWLRRRFAGRSQPLVDAGKILLAGGVWATVFGLLFGEALGSLGNKLGMPALWFYRGGPAALTPLLLFAIAIGAAHILLGLLIGLWSAVRNRQRSKAADRLGTLLVLAGLFALAGVLASVLPDGLLTPAVAVMVVGLVLACVSHGALGVLLGPLELIGAVGNVLSYLRVAAVGLASVYLANVANELAVEAPLVLGVIVATFFHVLNLALAAFSPTIQALRLHYVEFFSKFHDGGGRPFRPLGAVLDDLDQPPPATDSQRVAVPPGPPSEQLTSIPAG